MKLPWDKQYLKIAFHVVVTLVFVYCLVLVVQNIVPLTVFMSTGISRILGLLTPLLSGLVIAYLLDPIVGFYQKKLSVLAAKMEERKKKKKKEPVEFRGRTLATTLTYLSVLLFFTVGGYLIYRNLGSQKNIRSFEGAMQNITLYIDGFNEMLFRIQLRLAEIGFLEQSEQMIEEVLQQVTGFIGGVGNRIVELLSRAGGHILNFVLALVIGFYLLKDKEKFLQAWKQMIDVLLPEKAVRRLTWVWRDIDDVLSGYIRGELIDSLIMATLISITLTVIGIDFPIIIGIVAGLANLIPYFGSVIGVSLAVTVGLISNEPIRALYAFVALIILQQIDGSIIVPKVVGENVDLHPVFVLLSIVIAGSLLGIPGMILAVPVTATCKIFLERYIKRRQMMKETE